MATNIISTLISAVERGGVKVAIAAIMVSFFLYRFVRSKKELEEDRAFGAKHGCMRMETTLPHHWPFALDVLKKQYDAIPLQRLLAFQFQYFDKIGPNMRLGLFGQEGYMTTDPKNVGAILSTHFEGVGTRLPASGPWKHSRELLRRQFVRIQYQNLAVFDEHINSLISGIRAAKERGGSIVDLQPFFFKFTLATTKDLLFREPVGALRSDVQDTFGTNFDYASMICALRLRLADFHWFYKPKKLIESCSVVKQYADHFVAQALKDREGTGQESASERYPFILDLYEELKDPALVRDQLVHVLIAGRDTTACLLSWVFFLLVRHPVILAKLRSEIVAVIPEAQRLYPQLPVNVRVTARTTILPSGGGPDGKSPVLIRKGTGVGWSTYHMHRMTSTYGADASEFVPDRWADGDLEKSVGIGYMPFHAGPRMCLGKEFALSEASYAIIRIIQTFPNLRLPPHIKQEKTGQERQNLTIVVAGAEGCKVLLE